MIDRQRARESEADKEVATLRSGRIQCVSLFQNSLRKHQLPRQDRNSWQGHSSMPTQLRHPTRRGDAIEPPHFVWSALQSCEHECSTRPFDPPYRNVLATIRFSNVRSNRLGVRGSTPRPVVGILEHRPTHHHPVRLYSRSHPYLQ